MDPKQPANQLDPKLKEAYERVMGTMPAASTPQQPVNTPPAQPMNPSMQSPIKATAPNVMPTMPHEIPSTALPVTHPVNPQSMMTPPVQPINSLPVKTEPMVQSPLPQPAAQPMGPMHATVPLSTQNPVHAPTAQIHGFVAPKKKSGISPILLIAGGIVFVIAYTLIWVKIFNVHIPFLGQ